jgi:hypothetical protein
MTTALEGVRALRHAPAALYPQERPGTHCTGGWVGSRAGLDRCGKSQPPPGFDPRTFQPVVAIPTELPGQLIKLYYIYIYVLYIIFYYIK